VLGSQKLICSICLEHDVPSDMIRKVEVALYMFQQW